MSEIIAIPHYGRADRKRRHIHPVLLRALLVALIALLGAAIAASTFDIVSRAIPEQTAALDTEVAFPARELPPEWQWHPPGVAVEHMYRKQAPQRLDWIRRGDAKR